MNSETPLSKNNLFYAKIAFDLDFSNENLEKIATGFDDATTQTLHVQDLDDEKSAMLELHYRTEPNKADIHARLSLMFSVHNLDNHHIQSIEFGEIEDKNWLLHVYQNFPPVTIGRFYIYGSHYEGDIPSDLIPLKIDAATAFGSGEHQTTKGCLLALQDLHDQGYDFKNILDMGCGSGILIIAAHKLWPEAKTTAVDIDPESVKVTNFHANENQCENIITAAGDGFNTPIVDENAPYDLILANILAKPLMGMAAQFEAVLGQGGFAILSGLLLRQSDDMIAEYQKHGIHYISENPIENWQALVLRK